MRYRVFDDMSMMTQEDIERLLPLVSIERREKALRYRHMLGQWTALKSYEMLCDMLGAKPGVWHYNEYGKPFLSGGPEFSLSHCRAGVAIAIDEHPVGIDIETIRPYNESLARYVMNDEEMRQIDGDAVAFTRLWTQKEAVLKLRGTGIKNNLRDVLIAAPEHLTTWVNLEKGYCVSIAETK